VWHVCAGDDYCLRCATDRHVNPPLTIFLVVLRRVSGIALLSTYMRAQLGGSLGRVRVTNMLCLQKFDESAVRVSVNVRVRLRVRVRVRGQL